MYSNYSDRIRACQRPARPYRAPPTASRCPSRRSRFRPSSSSSWPSTMRPPSSTQRRRNRPPSSSNRTSSTRARTRRRTWAHSSRPACPSTTAWRPLPGASIPPI
uniref:(northern house mosquito) hypothetical protein n=1 Tax=Culex pipiens TaxID=7175 RepID=A0A8D8J895_CULPI